MLRVGNTKYETIAMNNSSTNWSYLLQCNCNCFFVGETLRNKRYHERSLLSQSPGWRTSKHN